MIITGDESSPTICARGQRPAGEEVSWPEPQPRSTTNFGSTARALLNRSTNGRERSSANSEYLLGSQTVTDAPGGKSPLACCCTSSGVQGGWPPFPLLLLIS